MSKKEISEVKPKPVIGRVESLGFLDYGVEGIVSRIDTGARTSSLWASDIRIDEDKRLNFTLFGPSSEYYTGIVIKTDSYDKIAVATSTGHVQVRYRIKTLIKLKKKKIRASFTLADRSTQVYPILIGRNILRGKFIVDVSAKGKAQRDKELRKIAELNQHVEGTEE